LTSGAKPFQHDKNKQGTRAVDREGPRQLPVASRTLAQLDYADALLAAAPDDLSPAALQQMRRVLALERARVLLS
jgi:hypothetical protein